MILGFLEERGGFFLFAGCPPPFSFSLFLFISSETLIPFLQNSLFLSRQFTFKPFNNYFPEKE